MLPKNQERTTFIQVRQRNKITSLIEKGTIRDWTTKILKISDCKGEIGSGIKAPV